MALLNTRAKFRHGRALILLLCLSLGSCPARATGISAGTPFPKVTLLDAAGQRSSLELPRPGVALIQVWATWCAPCHESIPTLLRSLGSDPDVSKVKIILWNIDSDTARARAFLEERVGDLTKVELRFDPGGEQFLRLAAPGMPVIFIVADGVVRAAFSGYQPGTAAEVMPALKQALEQAAGIPSR
ncbi:MAG: TlpA family protein disulfide reductase [Candidatus Binatia bacterium]|nr:TlpA family protein disulfide reductase [Candidatus Binatia bacterium]